MQHDVAEQLALSALAWIAEDPERSAAFLGAAGATPDGLRNRVEDPEFLGFVLDHLLASEGRVMDFCAATGHRPSDVAPARARLPGGDLPEWT